MKRRYRAFVTSVFSLAIVMFLLGLSSGAYGATGDITTVAGNGEAGFSGDGGQATSAAIHGPAAIFVDPLGTLYIADRLNHRIRKVRPDGVISTVAGNGEAGLSGDGGPATSASLNSPYDVFVDSLGSIYVSDTANHRVRKVGADGVITTVAGNGTDGYSGDGSAATSAELKSPKGLFVDRAGNLYIADSQNNRVRKVATDGTIATVAGNGQSGSSGDGGTATDASLSQPNGIFIDREGNQEIAI